VSGSNEPHSQRHSKEDQDLRQIKEVVECQHQTNENSGRKRDTKKAQFGGGRQGEHRTPAVNSVVQDPNEE